MPASVPALTVLVVDDEPGVRMSIACALASDGHRVIEAGDGGEALALLGQQIYDVAILDVRLPRVDGIALFHLLRRDSPGTEVILMTAHPLVGDAVSALREGAHDYVSKPATPEQFLRRVAELAERRGLTRRRAGARAVLDEGTGASPSLPSLIGRSPAMQRVVERIDLMAESEASVLISGESGTGKELVARALHERSPRRARPFVAVNCAAFPETLLEAELFGHERGAFTGAIKRREGRFQAAQGGTLLLDEVAEIPLPAQAKLLRVLQERAVEPLGSDEPVAVEVRVIAATHQDLRARVASGRFRPDLYYRLNVLDLHLPPLRDRRGDLPILLEHFLRKSTPTGKKPPDLTPRAWDALERCAFPGNVRELANAIERAVVLSRCGLIDLEHLPCDVVGGAFDPATPATEVRPLAIAVSEFERAYLLRALQLADGRRARAAELLGISRKSLWEKLRQQDLGELEARAAAGGSAETPSVEPTR